MDEVRLPVFLDLSGKRVLVVGGGNVATRRAARLTAAGAEVVVVAPDVSEELARSAVEVQGRPFHPNDVQNAWLVLACTNDQDVNQAVAAAADAAGIWCIRSDDAEQSAAWLPASGLADGTTT